MKSNNNLQIEIISKKSNWFPLYVCVTWENQARLQIQGPIAFLYKNKQNQPRETKQRCMTYKSRGTGVNVSVEVTGYGSKSPLNVGLMAY